MLQEWLLRSAISGVLASTLYLVGAGVVARVFARDVARDVLRYDLRWGLASLAFGSPVIQGFALLSERYGIGFTYGDLGAYGWAWWLVSIPLYLLLWDLVFYATHRVLHWPWVYRHSHFRHHACRPPVAWSGIAIDPLETVLSGILPYTLPLLVLPFHLPTVYALNILLMLWATLLHSSFAYAGNAVLLSPKDHNLHHAYGLKNVNFAALFAIWDRLLGTLDRERTAAWWGVEGWRPGQRAADRVEPAAK